MFYPTFLFKLDILFLSYNTAHSYQLCVLFLVKRIKVMLVYWLLLKLHLLFSHTSFLFACCVITQPGAHGRIGVSGLALVCYAGEVMNISVYSAVKFELIILWLLRSSNTTTKTMYTALTQYGASYCSLIFVSLFFYLVR